MPTKIHSCYDDEKVCTDIAKSDLTMPEIAREHQVSVSLIYKIASGETRPELKVRITEILEAGKVAAMRLAKARARFCVARLVQHAKQDVDKPVSLKAIEKLLEMAGMATGVATADKQTIEIVLSAMGGNGEPAKKNDRLTGVWNGNNSN